MGAGDVLVADYGNARILVVRAGGVVETLTPRPGSGTNHLTAPSAVVFSTATRAIYALDGPSAQLYAIDPDTGVQTRLEHANPLDPLHPAARSSATASIPTGTPKLGGSS